MKKKIIIISVLLVGAMVALTSNSWAKRERGGGGRPDQGGRFEEFNQSGNHDFDRVRDRDPRSYTRRDFNRPGPGFKHKLHKGNHHRPAYRSGPKFQRRHHYRPPYRYKPKFPRRHHYRAPNWHGPRFRHWRHRPVYRRPHHSVVKEINHYYGSAEGYSAPEDEFSASATITDTGFSVSVGVKDTN